MQILGKLAINWISAIKSRALVNDDFRILNLQTSLDTLLESTEKITEFIIGL